MILLTPFIDLKFYDIAFHNYSVIWVKTEVMTAPEGDGHFQFTGMEKHLNSNTFKSSMKCALTTCGSIALLVFFFMLRPTKIPAVNAT